MPNRLQNEKSEYLLQHKNNPVDWYPWGKEAFEKSTKEDKPIFLSIGYSACHWCHVMEEESFEDQETADFLNKNFVSIKVDREERPDVDSIYMTSVQIIAGHGGWPMSSFLTPDRKPFFAGTYFPKEGRHGLPSFMEVLKKIALLYGTKRADIEKSSNEITDVLKKQFESNKEEIENDENTARLYIKNNLENDFDSINKGFGKAPKFPQPILHEFILEQYSKTKDEDFTKELNEEMKDLAAKSFPARQVRLDVVRIQDRRSREVRGEKVEDEGVAEKMEPETTLDIRLHESLRIVSDWILLREEASKVAKSVEGSEKKS